MLAIEAPKPGTVIHWHISDILTRIAGDMGGMYSGIHVCPDCGDAWQSPEASWAKRWHRLDTEGCNYCNKSNLRPMTLGEKWERLLRKKRGDYQYPDLVSSLAQAGFTTHINAYIHQNDETPHLRICDGHHRLAAAIELGLETVPVMVYSRATYQQ